MWLHRRKDFKKIKNPHRFLSESGSLPPMKGWVRNMVVSQPALLPKAATIESAGLKYNIRSLVWHSVLLISTIFVTWITGPTAQRSSVSGCPVLKYGEEFMTTMLCKHTFLKIIFLYFKRLWDSQMCVLGKINHFVKKLLCSIFSNHRYHLNWLHIVFWQSPFCISIVE